MNLEKALAEAPLKAANRWPIPFAVPSATVTVPLFGSSPSILLPVKYCILISHNAAK